MKWITTDFVFYYFITGPPTRSVGGAD